MGKMINKMYESFYQRCQVTKQAMVLTTAKLARLGIHYSKWKI